MTTFADLSLAESLQRALAAEAYHTPTPIQQQAIPPLLKGRDIIGCAQTGTGKTAAFALPILNRLASEPRPATPGGARVLVLTPTRELAIQIRDSFATYGRFLRLTQTVIFGGVGQGPQVHALARGVDILVATPGRLLDLMGQGHVRLGHVEVLVLDEADRMLDMGFIDPIRRIVRTLPVKRQTALFSATMPVEIERLAAAMLQNPVKVSVTPVSSTADAIDQRVMFVTAGAKRATLTAVLGDEAVKRVLVFTRTKHGANRLVDQLDRDGIKAHAIHGNKSQGARQRALEAFRSGESRVLVATDLAARGLDVDGVSHVINYELPEEPETYVHRVGRTARAGALGVALSLCAPDERTMLREVERLTKRTIRVVPSPEVVIKPDLPRSASADSHSGSMTDRGRQPRGRAGGGRHGGQSAGGGRAGGGRAGAMFSGPRPNGGPTGSPRPQGGGEPSHATRPLAAEATRQPRLATAEPAARRWGR